MPQNMSQEEVLLNQLATGSAFVDLGVSGLDHNGRDVNEDILPRLRGVRGAKVFQEMSENDPIVGALLFAIEMLIRKVKWRIDPASDSAEDEKTSEFIEQCMNDMEASWADTIAEIITFLRFGFSVHEIVYKERRGESDDKSMNSKYNDGAIGWRKLPGRAQVGILQAGWIFDENGDILGCKQWAPPDWKTRTIPLKKMLLFRTTTAKNNPEGRSILRNAYRPWYMKTQIENFEAIGIERDLAGLPMARVPSQWFATNASPEQKQSLLAVKKIVTNIRRDEQEGLVMPSMIDTNGNEQVKFELLASGGKRQFDTSAVIGRYETQILITVLADFIKLGHGQSGSYALGSDKSTMFKTALEGWLVEIEEVFNNQAIPRLLRMNGYNGDMPKLAHEELDDFNIAALIAQLETLSKAGMAVFPDANLESHLRKRMNLPEPSTDTAGIREQATKIRLGVEPPNQTEPAAGEEP